jgi:cobalt/nickel transport protein
MRWTLGLILAVVPGLHPSAGAHFNMLLPAAAATKKGEPVTFTYQWGHPFEHQLFDAPPPSSVIVLAPDGKKTDLTGTLKAVTRSGGEGMKVKTFQFHFTPEQRGDHVFVLQTPPIWMEEDGEFLQDTVKVVLHVQAQKGWETSDGSIFEVMPLTRPYGLQPGLAFQALLQGRPSKEPGGQPSGVVPLPGVLVEVERYNPTTPRELPPDEQITRTVRTDPKGVFVSTLTEPGWWALTASRPAGMHERDGKTHPLRQRSTLWVFVEDRPK